MPQLRARIARVALTPIAALFRAFLARFFENEITSGTNDLKDSFFWLISFLAIPGFFMPVLMGWSWGLMARLYGVEMLRTMARIDKTFYVGLGMIATGVISAIVWNSLLIDRRDALVLGVLPVQPATVVRAKLLALAAYVFIVAASMHALASASFGLFLASGNTVTFAVRGVVAHFGASCLASIFTLLAVAAMQGCLLAVLGPRLFQRVSALLQLSLVALILLALFWLPTISLAVNDTLAGTGAHVQPWILRTPPLWFLGVYEWMLGTTDPALRHLALLGASSLATVAGLTVLAYPLTYRRLMVEAVEHPEGLVRTHATAGLARALTAITGRNAVVRATSQFFLTTVARIDRHRFVIAIALGAVAAWDLPTITIALTSRNAPTTPSLALLALPLSAIAFMLVGLRVAASLPADLSPAWIFAMSPPPRRQVRVGLRRTMVALGVMPFVLVASPFYWRWWGRTVAVTHACLCMALGLCLIEALLHGVQAMPCGSPWRPEQANLKKWWPAYMFGFMAFTGGVPSIEMRWFGDSWANAWLIVTLVALALGLRAAAFFTNPLPPDDPDMLAGADILGLH
jgi:hypothetical protein